jgi:hypothetical protein
MTASEGLSRSDETLTVVASMRLDKANKALLFEAELQHGESMPGWLKRELLKAILRGVMREMDELNKEPGA